MRLGDQRQTSPLRATTNASLRPRDNRRSHLVADTPRRQWPTHRGRFLNSDRERKRYTTTKRPALAPAFPRYRRGQMRPREALVLLLLNDSQSVLGGLDRLAGNLDQDLVDLRRLRDEPLVRGL